MNYYYDIILNWSEQNYFEFYEWDDNDCLELIKKIPYIKVKHKTFLEIAENKIKITNAFQEKIKEKTLISSNTSINRIDALLITDNKNILALEFNKEGISINRSCLLMNDEINALEVAFSLKEIEFEYEIIEKLKPKQELRQIKEVKRIINLEITNLYQKNELSKLRYLYYEYKKEKCEDIKVIYENILSDLNKDFKEEFLKLYNIIKLSYHKV